MGVDHPELDVVAFAVEADQIGAKGGAAVDAQLADALRHLGDEEVVVVELLGRQVEEDVVVLVVDREEPRPDFTAAGHFAEGFSGQIGLRVGPERDHQGKRE